MRNKLAELAVLAIAATGHALVRVQLWRLNRKIARLHRTITNAVEAERFN